MFNGAGTRCPRLALACFVACLVAAPLSCDAVPWRSRWRLHALSPRVQRTTSYNDEATRQFHTICQNGAHECIVKDFALRVLNLTLRGTSKSKFQRKALKFNIQDHATRVLKLPFETHSVTSRDGYNLVMHRLPRPGAPPILLMHGIMETSACFLASMKDSSLGPFLYKSGYDVWLGNHRGNQYSQGHMNLSMSSTAYWNFSTFDMGRQDIPPLIDYILVNNGAPSLAYIGHSIGGEIGFAALSDHSITADLQPKINLFVALSPALAVHFSSLLRLALPVAPLLELLPPFDLINGLHLTNDLLTSVVCQELGCADFATAMFLTSKFDDKEAIALSWQWYPSSLGSKELSHVLQTARTGELVKEYDYGSSANMMLYKRPKPPPIDLSVINLPTAFLYGADDQLTGSDSGIFQTLNAMKASAVVFQRKYPDMGHHGFNYADGRKQPHWYANDILHLLRLFPGARRAHPSSI